MKRGNSASNASGFWLMYIYSRKLLRFKAVKTLFVGHISD
jgi:hypothetical protein